MEDRILQFIKEKKEIGYSKEEIKNALTAAVKDNPKIKKVLQNLSSKENLRIEEANRRLAIRIAVAALFIIIIEVIIAVLWVFVSRS